MAILLVLALHFGVGADFPTRTGLAIADSIDFLAVGIGGSVASGWMSYHLIEAPFLRLKRWFPYGAERRRVAAPQPSATAGRD